MSAFLPERALENRHCTFGRVSQLGSTTLHCDETWPKSSAESFHADRSSCTVVAFLLPTCAW